MFLILYPTSSASSPAASNLSHTIFVTPSFTRNFVIHHHFVTHHLSQTTLSHTIFHPPSLTHQLCHPPSFTFTHHLCHTIFVTHHLCHTIFHTQLRHTPSLSRHLSHTTLSYTPSHTGVALADIHLRFAWQAWHLVTSTIVLPGRRATYGTGRHVPSFHMASVALGDIHLRFAWQAWHLWHWAGSGGALGRALVASDAAVLCVAGVALGAIHLRFTWHAWHLVTWQAWHLQHRAGSGGALGRA